MKQFRIYYSIEGVLTMIPTYLRFEAPSKEDFDNLSDDYLINLVYEKKKSWCRSKESITIYR